MILPVYSTAALSSRGAYQSGAAADGQHHRLKRGGSGEVHAARRVGLGLANGLLDRPQAKGLIGPSSDEPGAAGVLGQLPGVGECSANGGRQSGRRGTARRIQPDDLPLRIHVRHGQVNGARRRVYEAHQVASLELVTRFGYPLCASATNRDLQRDALGRRGTFWGQLRRHGLNWSGQSGPHKQHQAGRKGKGDGASDRPLGSAAGAQAMKLVE